MGSFLTVQAKNKWLWFYFLFVLIAIRPDSYLRHDPRTRQLLPSLLSELAAKIRQYNVSGIGGLSASWRKAVQFIRRRNYPTRWWFRPLALAALRQGTPIGLLPRCLRQATLGRTQTKEKIKK